MRKPEQKLWDTFRAKMGKELDLQRVENLVGVGMADVYVGKTGEWVELKAPTAPARASTRLLGNQGLNVDQINWHMKANRYRARSTWVLIRDSLGRLFLVSGQYADEMNEWNTMELYAHSEAEDWADIFGRLNR